LTGETVSNVLALVSQETSVDDRVTALEQLVGEVATEDHREELGHLLKGIKGAPRRSRRNGS
jgi:hypothetical protein